jgi:hypothetical protein
MNINIAIVPLPQIYIGRVDGRLEPLVRKTTPTYSSQECSGTITEGYCWERDTRVGIYTLNAILSTGTIYHPTHLNPKPENFFLSIDAKEGRWLDDVVEELSSEFTQKTGVNLSEAPDDVKKIVALGMLRAHILDREMKIRSN